MVMSFRFFARSAIANCTRTSTRATTSATLRYRLLFNTSRVPYGRSLHTGVSRAVASPEGIFMSKDLSEFGDPQDNPDWRHPRHGFAVADYPRLVHIAVPRKTTEEDLKFLLDKAGFPDAQITLFYDLETGSSARFCYVKLADMEQVTTAVSVLSRFTLFGMDVNPEKYDPEKFPDWQQPSLFAGWKPSPSSDLKDRVVRPLITSPPLLLRPLMREQWILFQNLPPVDLNRKESRFEIVHELYKKFHQYDVVGITTIQDNPSKSNGWSCKVQFGSQRQAKEARQSYVEAKKFMGRPARAKTYRSGPNIQKHLWDFRQSLPQDTSDIEVGDLLEKKYRELVRENKKAFQRGDYPTPESAVGLKDTEPTMIST